MIAKLRYSVVTIIGLMLLTFTWRALGHKQSVKQSSNPSSDTIKLKHSDNPALKNKGYIPQDIPLIVISRDRLLITGGDTLYMLNSENQIVWDYYIEPSIFYDVKADDEGRIYLASSDGIFTVLNK